MQLNNDPKHSCKSTTECLKKKRIEVFLWFNQSQTSLRAVHKGMLANLNKLMQDYKEEWFKITPR